MEYAGTGDKAAMKTRGGLSKAWHLPLRSGSVWLLIGLLFTACSSGKEFQRFTKTGETGLYILRPNSPVLAIYSFDVDLYRYPGHFSQGGETLAKSVSLHTGEYIYLKLTPGSYLIHLKEQEGHRHILAISPIADRKSDTIGERPRPAQEA